MLQAARASLVAGRYGEAIAAYQAVLKRDPKNVDAMTHLGLIVAIGGGSTPTARSRRSTARWRSIPNYPPALLYRGQVLYEVKKDVAGRHPLVGEVRGGDAAGRGPRPRREDDRGGRAPKR